MENDVLICYLENEVQLEMPEYRVKSLAYCECLVAIVPITRAETVDVLSAHYLGPLWAVPTPLAVYVEDGHER